MTRRQREIVEWLRGSPTRSLEWREWERSYEASDTRDTFAALWVGRIATRTVDKLEAAGIIKAHPAPMMPTQYRLVEQEQS